MRNTDRSAAAARRHLSSPAQAGEGDHRASAASDDGGGGYGDSTKLRRRKRSVWAEAPSTALRAVPLPRCRGGGCRHKHPHPRGAIFCSRPSLATPLHESCPEKREGGGAPTGAYALLTAPHQQTLPPADAPGAARATQLRRYRRNALRARSPLGAPSRRSPGCYLWLSFGLRLPESALACAATNPFY
jgi:hypothetical protein